MSDQGIYLIAATVLLICALTQFAFAENFRKKKEIIGNWNTSRSINNIVNYSLSTVILLCSFGAFTIAIIKG